MDVFGSLGPCGVLGMVHGRSWFGPFRTGLGPVGCHLSKCCRAVGMRMHSSTLAAIGRAAF